MDRCVLGLLLLGYLVLGWAAGPAAAPPLAPLPRQIPQEFRTPPRYVGAASCAAMACHGGIPPIGQSEYTVWIQRDRHARAYSALYDDLATRIAENLGIERPEQDRRCLVCHSTAIDLVHGPKFAIEDGVSCEACHGPAERWLAPHSRPEWKQLSVSDKAASFGMTHTKDLWTRAEICVRCHVGAPGQDVNHDLIAAGHPALLFELDASTANMPPHWKEPAGDLPATAAETWAIGQAVSLKASLALLAGRARSGPWPEFAEFDCGACHHALGSRRWRQTSGYGPRAVGSTPWPNPHRIIMELSASSQPRPSDMGTTLGALRTLMDNAGASATEVARAADQALAEADRLRPLVKQNAWDGDRVRGLFVQLLIAPAEPEVNHTIATHRTMALGSVFWAISRATTPDNQFGQTWIRAVQPALDRLYHCVDDVSRFDGQEFLSELAALRGKAGEND